MHILWFSLIIPILIAPDAPSSLTWHGFDEGMALAKTQNKHVLLDVYTDWCGWCKTMDAKTYGDERVASYLRQHFVLIRLNPETDGPISYKGKSYDAGLFSQMMGVNGYPATVFFESDADVITVVPGYIQPLEFLPMLEYVNDDVYYKKNYSDFLKDRVTQD